MEIRLSQILTVAYFLLFFTLLKTFSIFSIALFIIAVLIGHFTKIRNGIKNLLYFLAALSAFSPLFSIFLIYLPFAVFGLLLTKRSFIRNYVLGFGVSFIPSTLLYLASTYLNIPLNIFAITFIIYAFPAISIFIAIKKKKPLDLFDVENKEFLAMIAILFFTVLIGANIANNNDLFMANGVRVFSTVQIAVDGLNAYGKIPIYNPAIAQGSATYLWDAPMFYVQVAVANYMLKFIPPILFFNVYSLFILFISTLALCTLLRAIMGKCESKIGITTLIAVTGALSAGLNFYFLQRLESFKQFSASPIDYLLLALILLNPKNFKEYLTITYLLILIMLIHIPHAFGVGLMAFIIFFINIPKKAGIRDLINDSLKWLLNNKLKFFAAFIIVSLLPLFYFAPNFIFKDFFQDLPESNYINIIPATISYIKPLFFQKNDNPFSLRYPDVTRNDDPRFGPFISLFGAVSFILLMAMFWVKELTNFRIFSFAYVLHFIATGMSSAIPKIGSTLGLFYGRTVHPYLLILLTASICTLISLIKRKNLKIVLIAIFLFAFILTVPYAKQNITNIHREQFASGEIYKDEINFIKQLPIDGRIMTYGLFSNAVDFGASQLTGRYFSRNERIELAINRTIYEKIHSQSSWGQEDIIYTKSGIELSNYLILGGYKYLFLNIGHPIGNSVLYKVYPNFSYPIYQNGPLVFLVVNNTNYAEKVELVKDLNEKIYAEEGGYKYTTISRSYDFKYDNLNFKDTPNKPEPLRFERLSPTKVRIFGNFNENGFVVFKEQYFTRWKAYMGGKEVPVMANNHDLILIKTINGDNILLEYSALIAEKILGIASLVGFLGLAILIMLLL